jgi:hypothetical protein
MGANSKGESGNMTFPIDSMGGANIGQIPVAAATIKPSHRRFQRVSFIPIKKSKNLTMQIKNLARLSLSAVTLFILITSCKKSNNTPSNSLSATIGATSVNTTGTTAWYSTDSVIYEIGGYNFSAHDTTTLAIILTPPFTLNTVVPGNSSVSIDYYDFATSKDYFAGYGLGHTALTVTSLDTVNHKIAGNFTATLYNGLSGTDSVLVTNGKFSTSYSVQP